jgi:hypothetical protein
MTVKTFSENPGREAEAQATKAGCDVSIVSVPRRFALLHSLDAPCVSIGIDRLLRYFSQMPDSPHGAKVLANGNVKFH